MKNLSKTKIGILGFGTMGQAFAQAFIRSGLENIYVCDHHAEKITKETKVKICKNSAELIHQADVVMIAVKPQNFVALAQECDPKSWQNKIVLSIMAGISVQKIKDTLEAEKVVRAMPNLAAKVGHSVTMWFSSDLEAKEKTIIKGLLATAGIEQEIKNENAMHDITVINGCGPAYFYYLTEIMAAEGLKSGLTEVQAQEVAKQTFIGAAKLFEAETKTATELRQAVTSKAGVTEAVLQYFNKHNAPTIMQEGMQKGVARSKELAGEMPQTSLFRLNKDHIRSDQKILQNTQQKLIDKCLKAIAQELVKKEPQILAANQKDLTTIDSKEPIYDRILLTPARLKSIAESLEKISTLASPVGSMLEAKTLPNGLHLEKIAVPLGVVAVIYEARPNVTVDVFALCFKTQNIAILKCGSEAYQTSKILIDIIQSVLARNNLPPEVALLLPPDREVTMQILQAQGIIDVLIPRGSAALIQWVRENARIPTIETGAGIVHTYLDKAADKTIAEKIIFNAKTRRPSVCNSLDTLIIHQERLADLPFLTKNLAKAGVEIFADKKAYQVLHKNYPAKLLKPATPEDFGNEFLSLKMAIKTVNNIEEALEHISQYGSKHSEAIITQDFQAAEYFLQNIDAAAVYHNTSTAFTDGGQFGLGAEIGISTQKLHARGPMALKELTTYKWLIQGNGQVRT